MKKRMTITLPESWADVKLQDYLELQTELKNYGDDEEAVTAVLLWKLCGIDGDLLQSIPRKTFNELKAGLSSFLTNTDLPLQRIITIGGKEYGFEPNLSNMSYGAYADITAKDNLTIDGDWSRVMGILYRPITKRSGGLYNIEPYTGQTSDADWNAVTMDIHFGAFFFFLHLSLDLLNATQNSLMEMAGVEGNWELTSLKNGELMEQLLNLQMGTLRKLIPLHENL